MLEDRIKNRLRRLLLGAVIIASGVVIGFGFKQNASAALQTSLGSVGIIWAALTWE
jgi:uncharacterized BrkB/YihY/UPF0761 family membrane protein